MTDPLALQRKYNMTKKSNQDSSDATYKPTAKLIEKIIENLPFPCDGQVLIAGYGICDLTQVTTSANHNSGIGYRDLHGVESDPELCETLEKRYVRIINDSLLSLETLTRYGCIIMTPVHYSSTELSRIRRFVGHHGTLIAAYCDNCDNYEIAPKKLAKDYPDWDIHIVKVPNGFKAGKHNKGGVIIKMTRPKITERNSALLQNIEQDARIAAALRSRTLPDPTDELNDMIHRCVLDQMAGLALFEEHEAMLEHLLEDVRTEDEPATLSGVNHPIIKMGTTPNKFIEDIRKKYWRHLFLRNENLAGLPSGISSNVRSYTYDLGQYDFNGRNILRFRDQLQQLTGDWIKGKLCELFAEISGVRYSWDGKADPSRIIPFDGYKTEKAWRMKNKVTISLNGLGEESYGHHFFHSNAKRKIHDIELLFDYLAITKPDGSTEEMLEQAEREEITKGITLRHIEVSFYKKGTTGIKFLAPRLLERFNIFVCQQREWLPPGYGKTAYEDFDAESRAVIDSFQGEDAYRAFCNESPNILHSLPTFPLP